MYELRIADIVFQDKYLSVLYDEIKNHSGDWIIYEIFESRGNDVKVSGHTNISVMKIESIQHQFNRGISSVNICRSFGICKETLRKVLSIEL